MQLVVSLWVFWRQLDCIGYFGLNMSETDTHAHTLTHACIHTWTQEPCQMGAKRLGCRTQQWQSALGQPVMWAVCVSLQEAQGVSNCLQSKPWMGQWAVVGRWCDQRLFVWYCGTRWSSYSGYEVMHSTYLGQRELHGQQSWKILNHQGRIPFSIQRLLVSC